MIEPAILIGLASWRVASLVVSEQGPFDIFQRIRIGIFGIEHDDGGRIVAVPDNVFARLVSCVWCFGLWSTPAVYGLWEVEPIIVMVIAAAAILTIVETIHGTCTNSH